MKKLCCTIIALTMISSLSSAQQNYYDVNSGSGNGLRFWGGMNNYKIHMGVGTEYQFGPVDDYSIKMNMNPGSAGRGWTWGVDGSVPVASINSIGRMQLAQSIFVGPYYNSTGLGRIAATGSSAEFSLSNRAVSSFVENPTMGERWVFYNDGTSTDGKLRFWSGSDKVTFTKEGNVGIGHSSPQTKVHLATSSANTNLGAADFPDIGIYLQNTNNTNNNMNSIFFADAAGWGVAGMLAQVKSHTSHTGVLSFLTRKNGAASVVQMHINEDGFVGIGTMSPNQKLTVNGTIYGKEVKVDLSVPGPDYVFEKSYALPSLDQVKSYIDENRHLPEVPSASEMEKNGINLSEMNMLLLKKVEELTLYVIELKNENEALKTRVEQIEQIKK